MTNSKISVFFDTNSYRQIVRDKNCKEISDFFNSIRSAEKNKNIEPISAFTVNFELAANLVEGKGGVNYENCLNGLRFLTQHCYDTEEKIIRISSLPFLQVSAMIFGAIPIDYDRQTKKISRLFEPFMSFDKEPKTSKNFYEFVKTTLNKQEANFSNNLIGLLKAANYGMDKIYPNKDNKFKKRKLIEYFKNDSYAQHLSVKILKIIAEDLEIKLTDDEFEKRAYFLRTELPISSAFLQWILCEIIHKNIDMTSKNSKAKRWNWIWDYQISFLISKSTINNGKILLVTSDKEIIEIINSKDLKDNIMDVNQYLRYLNINGSC